MHLEDFEHDKHSASHPIQVHSTLTDSTVQQQSSVFTKDDPILFYPYYESLLTGCKTYFSFC